MRDYEKFFSYSFIEDSIFFFPTYLCSFFKPRTNKISIVSMELMKNTSLVW